MIRREIAPGLTQLTTAEVSAVASMFRLYDYKATGKIPPHLAEKLISSLGFDLRTIQLAFTPEVTLPELLFNLDQIIPPPEPMLQSSLKTFNGLVGHTADDGNSVMIPSDISDFMESLGRPPAATREASLLLSSMLEYDDCALEPVLKTDLFNKEITNFAKKTNALKDLR